MVKGDAAVVLKNDIKKVKDKQCLRRENASKSKVEYHSLTLPQHPGTPDTLVRQQSPALCASLILFENGICMSIIVDIPTLVKDPKMLHALGSE